MFAHWIRPAVVLAVALLPASLAAAPTYSVDILSRDFYPQLRDSWMTVINDHGVAGGYIATQSASGPRVPTLYPGGGNFQPVPGAPNGSVLGLSSNGVAVGESFVFRNGVVTPLPPVLTAAGVSRGGTIYGYRIDPQTEVLSSFIQSNGVTTNLSVSGLGVTQALPYTFGGSTSLNDAGSLAVLGFNDDFSVFGAFLFDIPTGTLSAFQMPPGFPEVGISQVLADGRVFGTLTSADFTERRYGFWAADGTFLGFFDPPAGVDGVRFNDIGMAIGLLDGVPYFFDGQSWTGWRSPNLNGYTLLSVDDFNNRGDFVGLAVQPGGGFAWGYVATRQVPEPASVAVFGGLLAAGAWAARRRTGGRA